MQLVKIGTGLGIGMMGLGVLERLANVKNPAKDPMGVFMDDVGGSLIVFGFATIVITSVASACLEGRQRHE